MARSAAARVPEGSDPTIRCSRLDLFQTGMMVTPCRAACTQAANCGLAWCANRSPTPSEYFSRNVLVTNRSSFLERTHSWSKPADFLLAVTIGCRAPAVNRDLLNERFRKTQVRL